jgi:3-oxoacyl-[acyl-carrier protein] reductase
MSLENFKEQVVVVTGGTRGIGAGIVKNFLEQGAKVVATYAGNEEKAKVFKESLGALSDQLLLRSFDVSQKNEVEEFWLWLEQTTGKCDVLVNNAGIRQDQILASMQESQWDRVLDVNLKGSMLMSQNAVLMMMKKRYGRIINMSSIGGQLGLSGQANYAASKAGQIAMSKVLSKEVAKRGITVNNVLPGFIETELIGDLPEEQVKEYKKTVPLRRFGTTDEVAHAVLFLASSKAAYITGSNIEVTGGL